MLMMFFQELRRERRILSRSATGFSLASGSEPQTLPLGRASIGPDNRSKTQGHRPISKAALQQNYHKRNGPATAHDSQGRALFTRISDGKLVYLRCCVAGCEKTTFNFATIQTLRKHISSVEGRHKLKGKFIGHDHAVEVCGRVAPGQEDFHIGAGGQTDEIAPVANTAHTGRLKPLVPSSGGYGHERCASFGSITDTMVDSSDENWSMRSAPASVRDLGKTYRASSTYRQGGPGSRTGAQLANATFLTSVTEDEDEEEGQPVAPVPVDRIDQHVAGNKSGRRKKTLIGADLYEQCSKEESAGTEESIQEVTNLTVKEEREATPSLSLGEVDDYPSPVGLITPAAVIHGSTPGADTMEGTQDGAVVSVGDRKRPASTPPSHPFRWSKRPRSSDEPSTV